MPSGEQMPPGGPMTVGPAVSSLKFLKATFKPRRKTDETDEQNIKRDLFGVLLPTGIFIRLQGSV